MRHLRMAIIVVACGLCWHFTAQGAAAQPPPPPHAFFGEVTVDGQAAPVGTVIESRGEGIRVDIPGNPITTTVAGRYGGPFIQELKLIVQGQATDGLALEFYVNGRRAECAVPGGSWQPTFPYQAGAVTALNLRLGADPSSASAATATLTAPSSATPARGSTYQTATPQTPRPEPATPDTDDPLPTSPAQPAPAVQPTASPTPPPAAVVTPTPSLPAAAPPAATPLPAESSAATATPITADMQTRPDDPPAVTEPAAAPTAAAIAAAPRPTSTPLLQARRHAAAASTPVVHDADQPPALHFLPALAAGSLFSAAALAVVMAVLRKMRTGG